VLHDFAKADEAWLDDVLRGVSEGIADLAAGDPAKFLNAVALRVNPPRSGTGQKAPVSAPPAAKPKVPDTAHPDPEPEDTRSALQKLMERFR
jgi:PTH1 family peptidyl-tRNA hydrolase